MKKNFKENILLADKLFSTKGKKRRNKKPEIELFEDLAQVEIALFYLFLVAEHKPV